jgi:hypothetical protein
MVAATRIMMKDIDSEVDFVPIKQVSKQKKKQTINMYE